MTMTTTVQETPTRTAARPRPDDRGGRASMRAYVVQAPFGVDALAAVERSIPQPGPNEVLVRIRAVALNYRDLLIVNGAWKAPEPRVPGSDGAGEVVAVGDGVTRVAVGDRVAGTFYPRWIEGEATPEKLRRPLGGVAADGVLAEYVLFDQDAVVRVPAHLSDEEAATLPCAGLTAWHAIVRRGGVRPGDTVLVQGTGGVSLFALQFARLAGARVIVTSSSDEKLRRARALGAAEGINYRDVPDWERRALELTGGRGVDHVVEVVGGEHLNRSVRAVRLGGTISIVGLLAGTSGAVDVFAIASRNAHVHGIEVGSREMLEEMHHAVAANALRPVVDRVFEADEVRVALRYLESGAHFGKVCVRL
jgi:NADPH:quinone reductase-like Zn-dependent oxidoreductase